MAQEKEKVTKKTEFLDSKDQERLDNEFLGMLKKGKNKGLSPVEYVHVHIAGKHDGKRGFPKHTIEGSYESSFIKKENDMNEENKDRLFGEMMIFLRPAFETRSNIIRELKALDETVDDLSSVFAQMSSKDFSVMTDEERVNEAIKRRGVKRKIKQHEDSIREKIKMLIEVNNYISQSEKTACIVSERILNHSKQRLDVYYRAALRKHPNKAEMPATIEPLGDSDAETTYMRQQQEINEEIQNYLGYLSEKHLDR